MDLKTQDSVQRSFALEAHVNPSTSNTALAWHVNNEHREVQARLDYGMIGLSYTSGQIRAQS